jgi:MoxR-like ATPase
VGVPDSPAGRVAARFVGRAAELARLEGLLGDEPPVSVVLLHGPPGVGKSALLRELARRAGR